MAGRAHKTVFILGQPMWAGLVVLALGAPKVTGVEPPYAVFDLADQDYVTFSPQEMVSECTKILNSKAIQLSPETIGNALFRRGEAHLALGEPKAALEDYDRCLSIVPGEKTLRCRKAGALAALKRYEEAEKEVSAIIS